MRRPLLSWLLTSVFLVVLLGVVAFAQRKSKPATLPLDDWNIPDLVAHLNREGMEVRMVSTQKKGVIGNAVFLTTTDEGWEEFNGLTKDPRRIAEWRGVLYCEWTKGRNPWRLANQWGENCLVIGPFLLYGDRELLARVRAALHDFAPG